MLPRWSKEDRNLSGWNEIRSNSTIESDRILSDVIRWFMAFLLYIRLPDLPNFDRIRLIESVVSDMIRHYTIPRNYRNPPHQTLFDTKFYNEILSIPNIGLCRSTALLSSSTHRIRSYVTKEIPQESFIFSYRTKTQSPVTSLRFRIDVRINSL